MFSKAERFEITALTLLSLFLLSSASWTGINGRNKLDGNAIPTRYVLEVEPDFQTLIFKGNVKITFEVKNATSLLVLNQKYLTIQSIAIDNGNSVRNVLVSDKLETVTVYFKEDLEPKQNYTIDIKYEGVLNDQKRGFYRSRYLVGKDVKWIAVTHFEPTGARLAFPCWDEPEYKAIFDISIKHLPKYMAVISNMPVFNTTTGADGKKITTFESTKRMSTYLVAFSVSDYDYKFHYKDESFKIYTKPDSIEDTEYALEFSVKAMKELNAVTGIKYSDIMPKMDQITVKDFAAGAMENWGLITYRENYLLHKEGITTSRMTESMVTTIAHEFAHQWFGNLVGPKWWEFIWLNEGFATFFQYYITNRVDPSWRLMELFVVEALQGSAFSLDGYENARPMNQAVDSPAEISKLFDSIAYQKAGSVIRMMHSILTEKHFMEGLYSYLKANQYNVADSDELIKHLQASIGYQARWGGARLDKIMKTWITRPGYPVVTVIQHGDNYLLSQERFLYHGFDEETKWWIPITYVTKDNLNFTVTTPTMWLKPTEDNLKILNVKSDWIIVNKQQTGYYRVNYEKQIWEKLTRYLLTDFKKIHPINRAQLIDDALNLARKNFTSYSTALNLTLYLHNETDYIPWMTTFRNLDFLNKMISTSEHYQIFKDYIKYIMQGITKDVKYEATSEEEDHPTKILRANAAKWACKADVKECVDYANEHFQMWLNDDKHLLDADLKTNILCTGLKTANKTVWETVLTRLANSTYDKDERNSLLGVMGCSQKREILESLISEALKSNPNIDLDVAVGAIVSNNQILKNTSSVRIVLDKLKQEYKNIMKLDNGNKMIQSSIASVANALVNEDDIIEMHKFIANAGIKADVLSSAMEKSSRNLVWTTDYKSTVERWLVESEGHIKLPDDSGTGTITLASFLLVFSIFVTRFCMPRDLPLQMLSTAERFKMTALTLLSLFLLSSISWSGIDAKYRLENNVIPIKYMLELEPDLKSFKFTGNVTISFEVKNLTYLLVLNQKKLTIKSVEIENNPARFVDPNDDLEILTIYFKEGLRPYVVYSIKIKFEGVLNDQNIGFYKSRNFDGKIREWVATTHFQPTGARLAFPCWDEPEYKAIFDISIRHLPKYTSVISNMPVLNTIDDGGMKVTSFESTKPMSTYLVAFVVSDYVYRTHDMDDNFKIYTKPASIDRTKYSVDFSVKAMEQLNNVTGIKYSEFIPKIDQVAIRDFTPLGMENWGLIIYREHFLLYKEGVDTNDKKQQTALTIAHELAHQWFGNLVSPRWWDYIWLSEGFATFYLYYITDKIEPTWRLMELFVVDTLQGALLLDATESARPLNYAVENPNELPDVFASLIYQKGGSVIRMMCHILTEEVFVKGVRMYLKDYQYKIADSDDLIEQLQAAAGDQAIWEDVKFDEIMKTWITKPGYPVVIVKQSRDNFVLSQERFLYYGYDEETKWWIPITYVTKDNLNFTGTAPTIWLKPTADSHTISNVNSDWILLNNLQTGYYRVNYEKHIWEKITHYLFTNFEKIHVVNRAQLIDDVLHLARRNYTNYETALNLTLYLKNETDYIPWMSAFRNLDWLRMMFSTSKHYNIFKDYFKYIMQGLTKHVQYKISPQDSHTMKILKTKAFQWACRFDVKECIDSAKKEFDMWVLDDKYQLDVNLKGNILCSGLRSANETLFEAILKRLATTVFDSEEKTSLLGVLGCSRNSTILRKLLVESLKTNPAYIELEVAVQAIVSNNVMFEAENISSIGLVLNKLKEEYKKITKLKGAEKKLESCMYSIAKAIIDEDDIIKMHKFIINAKPKPKVLVQVMQISARNIEWVLNYRSTIEKWLIEHKDQFRSPVPNQTNGMAMVTFTLFLLIPSIFITRFY
nr:uncharacterized protein LOC117218638 [Megalopta genalis]